jgi:hypothetical protein
MGDNDKPRHFTAATGFYLDITFDAPLPAGAYPQAELHGPLESGSRFQLATGSSMPDGLDPKRVRVSGNIPDIAPPGTYKVVRLSAQWATDPRYASYTPVELSIEHLGEDRTIIIDPLGIPPQPAIPRVTDLD